MGCRQVFNILLESTDSSDPVEFRETNLFRLCQEKGIIPKSEADLTAGPYENRSSTPVSPAADKTDSGVGASNVSSDALPLNLKIGNMWCPACAWLIDQSLKKSDGIIESRCNFSTDRLQIEYNPIRTSPDKIIKSIRKLGYKAAVPNESQDAIERRNEFIRFIISAILTMNVMMMSYALYSGFFTKLTADTIYKLSWPAFVGPV
jgi:copper chaperone CopZ